MYKYVFFDLDGTLTQSEFGIVEAAGRALAHFGIETPDRELLKRFIGNRINALTDIPPYSTDL